MKAPNNPATIAAYIGSLCNSTHGTIVVSPLVWFPGSVPGTKEWSFSINIGGRAGNGRPRWRSISVSMPAGYEPPPTLDPAIAAMFDAVIRVGEPDWRAAIINTLRQRGASVRDISDELEAIRMCERLWPGPKVSKVRRAIEQERAQWAAEKQTAQAAL